MQTPEEVKVWVFLPGSMRVNLIKGNVACCWNVLLFKSITRPEDNILWLVWLECIHKWKLFLLAPIIIEHDGMNWQIIYSMMSWLCASSLLSLLGSIIWLNLMQGQYDLKVNFNFQTWSCLRWYIHVVVSNDVGNVFTPFINGLYFQVTGHDPYCTRMCPQNRLGICDPI